MQKTKIIMMIYLYLVSLISLIFTAVGIGNLVNTTLKAYVFPETEKRDYGMCNAQPYYYSTDCKNLGSAEQQAQIDNIIQNYEQWQKQNTGDACYKSERQKKLVDSTTMVLIALPLYLLHWSMIKKEKKEKEDETNS
jgi:hypothetical protein